MRVAPAGFVLPPLCSLFWVYLGSSLITFCRSHRCEIVKVKFLVQQLKKMGHFLTVTKDGILQFWSGSFSLTSSFRVSEAHTGGPRASAFAPGLGHLLLAEILGSPWDRDPDISLLKAGFHLDAHCTWLSHRHPEPTLSKPSVPVGPPPRAQQASSSCAPGPVNGISSPQGSHARD